MLRRARPVAGPRTPPHPPPPRTPALLPQAAPPALPMVGSQAQVQVSTRSPAALPAAVGGGWGLGGSCVWVGVGGVGVGGGRGCCAWQAHVRAHISKHVRPKMREAAGAGVAGRAIVLVCKQACHTEMDRACMSSSQALVRMQMPAALPAAACCPRCCRGLAAAHAACGWCWPHLGPKQTDCARVHAVLCRHTRSWSPPPPSNSQIRESSFPCGAPPLAVDPALTSRASSFLCLAAPSAAAAGAAAVSGAVCASAAASACVCGAAAVHVCV